MQPLPLASPPSGHPGAAHRRAVEDLRAALEGAVARILEAHRCEVAGLEQQLRASSQPPPGHVGFQPPPPGPTSQPGVLVPVQQPDVICSSLKDSAPDPAVVGVARSLEPKQGWVDKESSGASGATQCSKGTDSAAPTAVRCDALGDRCSVVPTVSSTLVRCESKRFSGPQWQWKHREGWKNYEQKVSDKIEEYFQRGHPKARLKAGKKGSSPMEIFFEDMAQHDASTGNTRDVRRMGADPWWDGAKRRALSHYYAWDTGMPRVETLEGVRARMKLIEMDGIGAVVTKRDPTLNLYKSSGVVAAVARSRAFQGFATLLVALNTIWIAIELDLNNGPEPTIGFQVVENAFCGLFFLEIAVRFAAYRRKMLCLTDGWFCFDSALVLPMVLDTWLLPLIAILVDHGGGDMVKGDLTVLRVARLLRITRMYRLLKSMPTMMTLLRGISTSIRPVSIAVCLLLTIIYIFSIVFRSFVDPGSYLEEEYFPSVTSTMMFLLMHGTFLDSVGSKGFEIQRQGGVVLMFIFLVYIFMTSFLMLNMLIGVVCEMVSTVKSGEQEMLAKVSLRGQLYDIMEVYDSAGMGSLKQSEFELFIRNVEVMQALHQFNVDIKGLGTLGDMVFSRASQEGRVEDVALDFDDIMSLAVRLKGTSACRVEDIVNLREFTKLRLETLEEHLMSNRKMFEENLGSMSPRSIGRPA